MMTMRAPSRTTTEIFLWDASFVGDDSVDLCFGRPWVVSIIVGQPSLVLVVLLVVLEGAVVISLVLSVTVVIVVVGIIVGRPALVLVVLLVVLVGEVVISFVLLVAVVIVVLLWQRIGSVSRAKAEMATWPEDRVCEIRK